MVERGPGPGGRAGRVERNGYALDTGPSVFTAPEIVADTLAAVGEKLEERLTLLPLETTYRAQFADGSHLDVHADPDAFADEVAALCGPAEADALRRYLADLAELYRLQLGTFIDRNLDSPLDLVGPELIALARRGGFGGCRGTSRGTSPTTGCAGCSASRRSTPGSRRSGRSPPTPSSPSSTSAPASGTRSGASPPSPARWPPRRPTPASCSGTAPSRSSRRRDGGCPRSAWPTASACRRTPSSSPPTSRTPWCRACGPRAGRSTRRPAWRCTSASATSCPGQAHHTISFGKAWRGVFDELTRRRGAPMSDPSLLVSMPSRTDRSLAPDGGQVLSIVAPTPNLDRRSGGNPDLDWTALGPRYRDEVLATLEARGWTGPDRRDRGRGDGDAAGLGRPGHGGRHAVRAGPHVRADRPVPALDPSPPRAGERRPRRVVGAAGRGRADGADQRAAGRRADHRTGAG